MSETTGTVCRDMQDIAQNCDPSSSEENYGYTYSVAPPPRPGENTSKCITFRRTVPPKYVIISSGATGIPRPREEFDQNVSRYSPGMSEPKTQPLKFNKCPSNSSEGTNERASRETSTLYYVRDATDPPRGEWGNGIKWWG
ncbi:hypothetical protein KM043_005326 [Ampulex compressa]|nr:hypothetical protein KM043_005326 [Ampulex compressa]